MAQVQQPSTTTLNGISSENGSNGNGLNLGEPLELQIQNGTPTKDSYGASSSMETDDQIQLSPASLRRRSTRASALKAQEKIKLKDDIVQNKDTNAEAKEEEEEAMLEEEDGEDGIAPKKRKLESGKDLDQFCFRFGLRTTDEGSVYAMTDESENSSIHSSEMAVVRAHHEKLMSREMTDEQKKERLILRKEAEASLRVEEAKLAILKKMKQTQAAAIQKLAESKKMTAHIPNLTNSSGAYKPIVAPPLTKSSSATNGKQSLAQAQTRNAALLLAGMNAQQQQELLQKLSQSSQLTAQVLKKGATGAQAQQLFAQLIMNMQQQQQAAKEKAAGTAATSSAIGGGGGTSSTSMNNGTSGGADKMNGPSATALINNGTTPQQISAASLLSAQQNTANSLTSAQAKLMASQTPQQRSLAARMAFRAQADKQLMMVSAPKAPPPDMFFIPNPTQPAFTYLLGLDLVVQRVLKDKTAEKKYEGPSYECEECHTDFTPAWKAIGSSSDDLHLYCEQCVRQAQKRKIRTDHSNFLKKAYQKISTQEKEFEKKIAEGTLEQVFEQARPVPSTPNVSASTSSTTPAVSRMNATSSGSGTSTPTTKRETSSSTPKPSSSSNSNSSAAKKLQQMQAASMQQFMSNPMAAGMMRNPAMLQQMMTMYATMTAAQAGRMPQMNASMAQMMNMMAQAAQQQTVQQQQAVAAAAQAAAAQAAQAQQVSNTSQQQLAAIAALMASQGNAAAASMMNPQVARLFQQMSAPQQKQLMEAFKNRK